MRFANCAALAAVLFTTLIENLRLCNEPRVLINYSYKKVYLSWSIYNNIITSGTACPMLQDCI